MKTTRQRLIITTQLLSLVGLSAFNPAALAVNLNNGSLNVDIRNDNGAIDTAYFGGTDFFNPGGPVSDWGLQNGTATGTFLYNNTSGFTQQPVSVSGLGVVSGIYTAGGANIAFTRSYSLVTGQNVLRVSTSFLNNGSTTALRYFDTFDPDQGYQLASDFGTYNDVFVLGGSTVGQSRINIGGFQHTVIAGSSDSRVVVAAGSPFAIGNGTDLNNFLSSPWDGNDTFADQGLHIGLEMTIAAGATDSFTYDLAFGLTPAAAQTAFLDGAVVPEPSTLALAVLGGLSLLLLRKRK